MKANKNLHSVAIASAALFLFLIISSTASAAPYGYITNRDSNTVSVIDISGYVVAATVPVGSHPAGIAVNPNGTKVYVTNWGDNTTSVIDTANNTVTAKVNVGKGPWGVAVTSDGKKVYVMNVGDGTVSVIDTVANNVIATVDVGGTDPRGRIAVTPDGKKVYVTNWVDDTVSVIDTVTNNVSTVKVGANPGGVAVTPDGTKVYVANYGSNDVSVIDTATNNLITNVPAVGWGPGSVAITPDGTKVYVATYHRPYYVYVIDTTRDKVIGEVKNIGKFPVAIAITTDGTQAYVVSEGTGTVSVIDTSTNEVKKLLNNIGTGGIAFQPAPLPTSPGDGYKKYLPALVATVVILVMLSLFITKIIKKDTSSMNKIPRNLEPLVKTIPYSENIQKWAIIVGISKYKDESLNLKYADRDAEELYKLLLTPAGGGFKEDHIKKLINEEATTSEIIKALRSYLKKPSKDDIVMLYFACHGEPDPDRRKNIYLLTHDTDPKDISGTSLPMREINQSLKEVLSAERVVIIADACHSAAIDVGIDRRSAGDRAQAINAYFQEISKTKEGIALLTSAEAYESSQEGEQWGEGHGVFTHFLLEGMRGYADGYGQPKDGIVTVGELFDYVRDKVREATNYTQHPAIGAYPYDRSLPISISSID